MRKVFLTAVLLITGSAIAFSQTNASGSNASTSSEEQAVLQVEQEFFKALNQGDANAITSIIADEFIGVLQGAGLSKPALLARLPRISQNYSYSGSDMKVKTLGETAVVYGRYSVGLKGSKDEIVNTFYYQFTDTFIKRQKRWQLAVTHASRIPYWRVRQPEDKELQRLTALSCKQESSLKSQNSDTPAYIRFTNTTNQPVTIYWLDWQGKRDPLDSQKAVVQPGQSSFQYSYVTHPFVIADSKGTCLAIYQPSAEPSLAVIK
ncbi:hypothetical protein GCM10023189_31490 [Nibrella saemangeumensis]|uniref:DUF4440 domain-containing protein n=1 Tax=Nibrella saemangeumensis TaxID=1084526 RepID=A0ABP8N3I5_9BACT